MTMDVLGCLAERDLHMIGLLGRANINYYVWKPMREHLKNLGMIESYKVGRRTMYRLTDKGRDLLRRYRELRDLYYGVS